MTCAACAAAVERSLNRIEGVSAVVNLATDRATVRAAAAVDAAEAVRAVERAGYTAVVHDPDDDTWSRRAAEVRISSLRRRLAVAALLAIPLCDITILLALVPSWRFPLWQALCVLLALPIVTWCAWPFHLATWRGIRHRRVSMDTLVSLGTVVSFAWALWTLLVDPATDPGYWLGFGRTPAGADAVYLDVAAGMVTFQLAGRYFETRSRHTAGDVLGALARLSVKRARVLVDGEERVVPTEALRPGDELVVLPGERFVVDGRVSAGASLVDTSAMTGETTPREVVEGDTVMAGSTNLGSRLQLAATAVGGRTRLAQMAAIAEEAQSRKARLQRLVDRVTAVFVPIVIVLAALVAAGWLLHGAPASQALANGVAVLIIACPCALGLATPTALMVGVGRGGQLGILIKSQQALESSGRVDTVVFDKTGTLTTGRMRVVRVVAAPDAAGEDPLGLAAAVEAGSEHPIAVAILERARASIGRPDAAEGFVTRAGHGAAATVAGRLVVVGTPELLAEHGAAVAPVVSDETVVHVAVDGRPAGRIHLTDELRPSAAAAVRALHELGLATVMLTGDAQGPARAVASRLGIERVESRVLPDEKAARVAALKREGHRVAMVGDGVNDSAALATADLGLAMVQGSDIAMKAADIIIVRDDLGAVADALRLSRRTLRTIRLNLVWAFGYNVAAIPLAAAGLLNPLIAAAAMAISSVLVVSNSLRLRGFDA
ncbi:MAG: heavy metal translocating P-type ATPase [Microbacteriaceae bacterium]